MVDNLYEVALSDVIDLPPNIGWLKAVEDEDLPGGCPIDVQPWCGYTPGIRKEQLIAGFVLIVTGFPMGAAMTNAIYSKIIGPFPQVNPNILSPSIP